MPENISLQSIVGKRGIPTPYIRKVTLSHGMRPSGMDMDFGETASPLGLLAKVELSLTDIKRRGRFQWVDDERLHKYFRIRIIESRNPELTKMLSQGGLTSKKIRKAKRRYNFREKIISLKSDKDASDVSKYRQRKGVFVYMFPYEADFFIPNSNPTHLAYFCSCIIDKTELTRDFGAKFKNRRFRDRVKIPNFKIQDKRVLKMLEDLEFNLDTDEEVFTKIRKAQARKIADHPRFSKKPNFASSAFISRDSDGKSNILFSVDTDRILKERGQFGKILSTESAESFLAASRFSRISSLKVFRRRVRKNRLGSNPRSGYRRYDQETKDELIAYSFDGAGEKLRRKVYKRDRDGDNEREVRIGFVKEVDLLNAGRLRTFSCTDFDIARVTDGIYQYILEVEMEDGTLEFVMDILRRLKGNKRALLEYSAEAQSPENYNSVSNRFTNRFIELNNKRYPQLDLDVVNNTPNLQRQKENPRDATKAPWNRSIVMLLEAVGALTNMSSDDASFLASTLHSLINPKTGTPQGVSDFVDAYEKVENKIRSLLGRRGAGDTEFDVNVKSSIHKDRFKRSTIKIRKKFNQVFNSDTQKGVGYDFLGGQKANRGGMREITLDFYQNRISSENSKYFATDPRGSRVPILDLRTAQYAYLSPAMVRYGVKKLKVLNSGKALWNRKRYNEATSVISSMRLDPTREELSAPVGTAKKFTSPGGLMESLSRNILGLHGISIERPRPKRRPLKGKEDIGEDEIVSDATLSEITSQAIETIEEDIQEEAEIEEQASERRARNLAPLNTIFVQKLINKDASDVFKFASKKGVAEGMAGFNLLKSNNILEMLYRDKPEMSEKIRSLPNQIKSLFLANRPITVNRWHEAVADPLLNPETYEMFRYNYFMLQKVEYLSGFETTRIDGRQITKPIFSLMDPAAINPRPGKRLLCRMSTYKNPTVYADIPKELRLPIKDRYFLIRFGAEEVGLSVEEEEALEDTVEPDEPLDRAARRLANASSPSPTRRRIIRALLEKENRAESYYQYSSTVFIEQPRDLIQEGAEIKQNLESTPTVSSRVPSRSSAVTRSVRPTRARTATTRATRGGGNTGGGGY